jgi:Telomere resolvase
VKKWLTSLLNRYLPMVEHLSNDQSGIEAATIAALWMKGQWASRGLATLPQQRNPMTETRNFLKQMLGEDHVSLIAMNFTTEEWREMNNITSDRVEERNENQKLITNPQAIVDKAVLLLHSHDWAEFAAGLAVLVGRRVTEVLSTMHLEPVTEYSVQFTGALKRRGEPVELSFEIPTLCPASLVLKALKKLRRFVSTEEMNPGEVNAHYGAAVIRAGDKHFHDLIPLREGRDSLYTHLYRTIYAVIATHWYCPPGVTAMTFKAQIQGHFQVLEAPTDEIRRSYAASRHYDDYAIGNEHGELDGRHGIKLNQKGVQILQAFQKKTADTQTIPQNLDTDTDLDAITDQTTDIPTDISEEPITVGRKPKTKPEVKTQPADQDQKEQPISATDTDIEIQSTTDQTQTTTLEIPTNDQAQNPPKKTKGKAGTYRIWMSDRPTLETFKTQLGTEATQADTIAHLISLANITLQLSGDWQLPTEALSAKAIELLQINKAQTHHIESFQKQIQQQKDQLNTLTTQNAQLQKELAELKQAKAITGTSPGVVVGSAMGGSVNEGIQAAVLSLAAAAVNLAQTIAGNQSGVGTTTTSSISIHQPTAAPITTKRMNTKRNPSTATGASTAKDSDSGDSRATVEAGAGAATTTIPENAPSSGKGSAIARIHRAVQSLMAFNDQQPKREDKWAINQSSLSRLTGANRPALQKYLADHGQEIQAHNHSHGLTDFHNIAKGRAGQDIKAQVAFEKDIAGS